jgi:DNA polymerase-3 subunit delta'
MIPEKQHRVKTYLDKLAADPPLSMLLEGGSPEERLAMADYWAMALNCPHTPPCQSCQACMQIRDRAYRDLVLLDAAQGLKVDFLREERSKFAQAAHRKFRVVVLDNAHLLNPSCANLLLKSLEEPNKWTKFILLVPLRENLLPTLVSRSFTLTLCRSKLDTGTMDEQMEKEFVDFCRTGRGWFKISSKKNAVTREAAAGLVSRVQKEILEAAKNNKSSLPPLSRVDTRTAQKLVDNALYCLDMQVNPAIVLDWLGTSMYDLFADQ